MKILNPDVPKIAGLGRKKNSCLRCKALCDNRCELGYDIEFKGDWAQYPIPADFCPKPTTVKSFMDHYKMRYGD